MHLNGGIKKNIYPTSARNRMQILDIINPPNPTTTHVRVHKDLPGMRRGKAAE